MDSVQYTEWSRMVGYDQPCYENVSVLEEDEVHVKLQTHGATKVVRNS